MKNNFQKIIIIIIYKKIKKWKKIILPSSQNRPKKLTE